jgi:hypothetical protein
MNMKITNTEQKTVDINENIQLQPEDNELLANVNAQFSEILSEQYINSAQNPSGISGLFDSDYNFDSVSMSLNDALFFVNLVHEGQFSVETAQNGEFQSLIQTDVAQNIISKKSVEVTNQLTSLIEKAQNTQKPVRISFDNDVSVVLKIDKHGKVTAEFIPGSAEVESYLKNNIAALRQRFDEQNLPYNDLFYRQSNRQNKNRNNKKGE